MSKFGKEYHRAYYHKRRARIHEYLGGVCAVCGTTENLEVDHLDPKEKIFNIAHRLSVKNIKDELAKCQLLCKQCHAKKTAKENEGWTHGTIYGWMKKKCTCEICHSSRRAWHEARNIQRRK